MQVALLTNAAYLDEQLKEFNQLVVGLIDEGVRVVQVVPGDVSDESTSLFGQRVDWPESRWRWMNRIRLNQVANELASHDIALLHVLDGNLWHAGLAIAKQLNVPIVLSANSDNDVDRAVKLARNLNPQQNALCASTKPIAQAIRDRISGDTIVRLIRPGVHRVSPAELRRESFEAACMIISGSGMLDGSYRTLMYALRKVIEAHPITQCFFDGQDPDQHEIWQLGQTLGLLSHMSLVPRRLGHREILLRADLMIQPQRLGTVRPVTLQAMAHGVPVIAQQDPWLDYLEHNQTACVFDEPSVDVWAEKIIHFIEHEDQALSLGKSAHEWVHEHHAVPTQVAQTLDLYRTMTGEGIEFPSQS